MDIEDLDKQCGFSRAELVNGKPPVGSVDLYHKHLFLCSGTSDWASNFPEKSDSEVVSAVSLSLKQAKKQLPIKVKLTGCDLPSESADGIDVVAYPEGVVYQNINPQNVESFISALSQQSEDSTNPADFPHKKLDWDGLIGVCSHQAKDRRCGYCGPRLVDTLRSHLTELSLQDKVKVMKITHVGGHKYAGNVILFPRGDWYGYVTPEKVPAIIQAGFVSKESSIVPEIWRGRLGLSEEQQKALLPADAASSSASSSSSPCC